MAAKHSLTSDFLHEFTCTPCSKGDTNKEAAGFCVECSEYFCGQCLAFHNRIGALVGHEVLGREAFRQAKTSINKSAGHNLPTDKCRIHFKSVDMYCRDHGTVCCSVCVALEHRPCSNVLYIPDITKDPLKGICVQAVTCDLTKTLVEIKDLKQDRLEHKTRLADERDSGLNSIERRRRDINEYLDGIDTTANTRIMDKHNVFSGKLAEDVKTCDEAIELLDEMNGRLQISCNPSQSFVNVKQTEQTIKAIKNKRKECLRNNNDRLTISKESYEYLKITLDDGTVKVFGESDGSNGVNSSDPSIPLDDALESMKCAICIDTFINPKTLSKCGHTFCTECIDDYFKVKPVCPFCFTVYGVFTGKQPRGEMQIETYDCLRLPGYERYGTIRICYNFPDGTQGEEHPRPGQNYKGTRRTAYLPDNKEGRNVLNLLRVAFKRRLVFTIGRFVTTGLENTVTWNDIHHKTNVTGGPSNFGYPDPDYFTRVTEELRAKGVTEADIK